MASRTGAEPLPDRPDPDPPKVSVIEEATPSSPPPPPPMPVPASDDLLRPSDRSQRRDHTAAYSRFVVAMKFVLPAVAGILVALVAAWPHLNPRDTSFRIGFSSIKAREADEQAVVNARYHGTDAKQQPYSISADIARHRGLGTNDVELEMPKADIGLRDGTSMMLTARNGLFSREQNTLTLDGAVDVFHDSGYELRTDKVEVDLSKGQAISDRPVTGQGPFGTLEAEGMRIENKGAVIFFTGKTKVVLRPGSKEEEQP